MKTADEIRKNLEHIREYYSHEKMIGHPSKVVYPKNFAAMLDAYNGAIKKAPANLQTVYNGLYVRYLTQKLLAKELKITEQHTQLLNRNLIQYFAKFFSAA